MKRLLCSLFGHKVECIEWRECQGSFVLGDPLNEVYAWRVGFECTRCGKGRTH